MLIYLYVYIESGCWSRCDFGKHTCKNMMFYSVLCTRGGWELGKTLCFNIVVLEIIFYNNETKLMENYIYMRYNK